MSFIFTCNVLSGLIVKPTGIDYFVRYSLNPTIDIMSRHKPISKVGRLALAGLEDADSVGGAAGT